MNCSTTFLSSIGNLWQFTQRRHQFSSVFLNRETRTRRWIKEKVHNSLWREFWLLCTWFRFSIAIQWDYPSGTSVHIHHLTTLNCSWFRRSIRKYIHWFRLGKLSKAMSSHHDFYVYYYNKYTNLIVAKVYAINIEFFGYRFTWKTFILVLIVFDVKDSWNCEMQKTYHSETCKVCKL